MNTRINTRCFNFGYDAEGLQRANTYSNKKGYTAMGGTTDPNVIMNLQNSEVDVVVLNGNRSARSTWAVYIPMKKHLESMGIVCEMNIESYNTSNNTNMEAQESIQQEASVDPIASASPEQAVIAQTEMMDEQSKSTNNEEQTSVESEAETKSAETSTKKSGSKASTKTTPALTQEQIDALKHETEVFDQEVTRMLADPRYHAVQMSNGRVILDLTAAHKDGIKIYRFDYNRTHGKDEGATGESLKKDGAQHLLLVVPVRVAEAAGLPISHFQKDPDQTSPCDEDGLAVVDGHGRANGAFGSKEGWPQLDASLLVKNKEGYIDTKKAYSVTNENVSVWGSKDHLVPRLFDPHELRRETLKAIHELVNKQYLYTAACSWVLWKAGGVTKKELNTIVTEEQANKFKEYTQHAKQIHEACIKKFGEGDDKLLKTKKFPEKLIEIWESLRDKSGADEATATLVKFIDGLDNGKANEIVNAKKDKDKDLDKDTVRKQLLDKAFKEFMSKSKTANP